MSLTVVRMTLTGTLGVLAAARLMGDGGSLSTSFIVVYWVTFYRDRGKQM